MVTGISDSNRDVIVFFGAFCKVKWGGVFFLCLHPNSNKSIIVLSKKEKKKKSIPVCIQVVPKCSIFSVRPCATF